MQIIHRDELLTLLADGSLTLGEALPELRTRPSTYPAR